MFGTQESWVTIQTMKACSKCGAVKPLTEFRRQKTGKGGLMARCKACALKADQEWYRKNKERRSAYHKEWYAKNREAIIENSRRWYRDNPLLARARQRAYYLANAPEKRAYTKAWYAANRETALAYHRAYRQAHPELLNARRKRWRAANPEAAKAKGREAANRRRARKASGICDLTDAQWIEILEAYGYCCAYCGKADPKLTQDHVMPIALGGGHTASNIVPACGRCNRKKWIKTDWVPRSVSA